MAVEEAAPSLSRPCTVPSALALMLLLPVLLPSCRPGVAALLLLLGRCCCMGGRAAGGKLRVLLAFLLDVVLGNEPRY